MLDIQHLYHITGQDEYRFPRKLYADRFYESLPVRLLQPPRKRMYLLACNGAKIPEQNKRPAAGPHRPACGSNARAIQRTIIYQNE